MNFFTIEFSLFFILFFIIYWFTIEFKFINRLVILIANFMFLYNISPIFLQINIYIGLWVYFCGYFLKQRSNFILTISICVLVLILSFFKYYDFLLQYFNKFIHFFSFYVNFPNEIIFPIGISFYTFLAITYIVDIYKKEIKIPSIIDFFIYFSFFPIITSGPIVRAKEFFASLKAKKQFKDFHLIFSLLSLAIIKKLFLANMLYNTISPIFINPQNYDFFELILSLFAYSFLLYFDFSAYINLITAIALSLGFELPKNFNKPFVSKNLKEFWTRWHITLSNFIKNYIYIPLSGSKKGRLRTNFNVLIAMLLSGIWHGNSINFMIWGLLHALGIIFLNITSKFEIIKSYFLKKVFCFTFVSFAWSFFCIDDLNTTVLFWESVFYKADEIQSSLTATKLLLFILIFLFLHLYEKFDILSIIENIYKKIPIFLLPFMLLFVIIAVYIFMPEGIPNFIYQGF